MLEASPEFETTWLVGPDSGSVTCPCFVSQHHNHAPVYVLSAPSFEPGATDTQTISTGAYIETDGGPADYGASFILPQPPVIGLRMHTFYVTYILLFVVARMRS